MIGSGSRVVVLGGKGMLGSELVRALVMRGAGVLVYDLPQFDITDAGQLKEAVNGHGLIINCAAYTDVERAESEPELAHKVNAEAAGRLGRFAAETGAMVCHISTDFVFDGESDVPYVETDATGAISAYGRSKLDGERLLAESGGRSCIIRVQWSYGAAGNNFVKKMISLARSGKALKVVGDQIGSPTAVTEAAGAICELGCREEGFPEGIFHYAASGQTSRYEMAKFIFDKLGLSVDLSECKTSDFSSAAGRPLNSRFDCSKIAAMLKEPIKPWQGPLEKFLEQL